MATASIKHILYPHIMAATYAYFLVTKCFSNSFCTAIGVASTTQTRHISKLSAFQQRSLIVAPHKVNTNLLGGYCQPRWATTVATPRLFYGNGRRRVTICNHSTAAAIEDILEPDTTKIASRWKFIPQDDETIENDAAAVEPRESNDNLIRNVLVCGDGDLSFSAEIASELDELGIQLYATVLEDKETHNTVYKFSTSNTKSIESYNDHKALFGVDATKLSDYFGGLDNENTSDPVLFDRIQFNFPHWRGKANNKYNRKLLSDFLQSAAQVLSPNGEIHVALCGGQGGCSAMTLQEWKGSWTASMFAADHGLLLARTFPFDAQYRLSSHRGVDRPFRLGLFGKDPKMHVFVKPDGIVKAPREIQLCCRHELHVMVPNDEGASAACSLDQILAGNAIENIIQNIVPDGIRVEVPARLILDLPHETGGEEKIAVFLVVYCSERAPLTRDMADEWRATTENEVAKYIPLRQNRAGRTVSRPFPYPALHPEIKYHTTGEK